MKTMQYSDKDIFEGIRNNNSDVLEYIYREYYKTVKRKIVMDLILNDEDARDIFQDALITVLINLKEKEGYKIIVGFKTYFFAVCRNIVTERLKYEYGTNLKKNIQGLNIDSLNNDSEMNPLDIMLINHERSITELKKSRVRLLFLQLRKNCQDLIKMVAEGFSFEQITQRLGYKNENHARKKKHLCTEYLVKLLKKDKIYQSIKDKQNGT